MSLPTSAYDVKLSSWDGSVSDILENCKGKVTLITNVTGHCGNAPQFEILQKLYDTYRDRNFEIVAIPTNQFCGSGVTYGEFEEGLRDAQHAYDFAVKSYSVTFPFTELVVSKAGAPWDKKIKEGEKPHEIFETLTHLEGNPDNMMEGNFEKWLVDSNGKVVKRYTNGFLLDFANQIGEATPAASEAYEEICKDIEATLEKSGF